MQEGWYHYLIYKTDELNCFEGNIYFARSIFLVMFVRFYLKKLLSDHFSDFNHINFFKTNTKPAQSCAKESDV